MADPVHDETFEVADLQRAVGFHAPAGRLAGCVADSAADRAEGVGHRDRFEGLLVLAFPDEADVRGGVGADGAGHMTGSGYEVQILCQVAVGHVTRHSGRVRTAGR